MKREDLKDPNKSSQLSPNVNFSDNLEVRNQMTFLSSDQDPNGDIFNGPKDNQEENADKDQILSVIDGLNSNNVANDEAVWPQTINI